jgi:hypothetical protein
MRRLDSLIMRAGEVARVPAGSAMAVDRDVFSGAVQRELEALPSLEIVRERVDTLPAAGLTIVATGPLTAATLAESIGRATGAESLAFFDAIAPIVHRDSIDMSICWMAARWDKGGKDYINCPMDKEQYLTFVQGLIDGEKGVFKEWEENTPYFEGCMPIEVMAERGVETLRFGPMKPVGLDNPHWATPRASQRPLAVRRGPAAAGQQARHLVEHGRVSDQAQARRPGAAVPHDPGARERRVRAARRAAPQHLPQRADAARPPAPAQERAAHPLRRPDHRVRGLCRKLRGGPADRPDDRGRARRPRMDLASAHHGDGARCSRTSPATPRPRATSR